MERQTRRSVEQDREPEMPPHTDDQLTFDKDIKVTQWRSSKVGTIKYQYAKHKAIKPLEKIIQNLRD